MEPLEKSQLLEKLAYMEVLDRLLAGHFQTFGYFSNKLRELRYFPELSDEELLEKVRNHFGVFSGNEKNETGRMQVIWKRYQIWERAGIEVRGEYVRNNYVSVIERI